MPVGCAGEGCECCKSCGCCFPAVGAECSADLRDYSCKDLSVFCLCNVTFWTDSECGVALAGCAAAEGSD